MKLDQFSNPIFNENDMFDALYLGHQTILPTLFADDTLEVNNFCKLSEIEFAKLESYSSINEFDTINQTQWFMPAEYFNFNVTEYCINRCKTEIEKQRVIEELEEYTKRGMTKLLQWLKYFVDTCKANDIVWGVGRGSSVSSFVLYILEVHRIDSIKYNLDWHDFLR